MHLVFYFRYSRLRIPCSSLWHSASLAEHQNGVYPVKPEPDVFARSVLISRKMTGVYKWDLLLTQSAACAGAFVETSGKQVVTSANFSLGEPQQLLM